MAELMDDEEPTILGVLLKIKEDMGVVKTDVAWLKRLFYIIITVAAGAFGVDVSGVLG